ncbi:hypothetical protein [Streptococcus equinus]|uniref:hypothetical protein n=1 Tax=Streptococcus equinus TaxID=1335 RepID=UPI0008C91E8C|nr:hypothetical protein [Streptococcus equinus]SEI64395.1 hypothetical protein SAMN05216423_0937 [Streptococcus equinus]
MEFYKEYVEKRFYNDNGFGYRAITATDQLNEETKINQQWRSEIKGYVIDINGCSHILVRWAGLSSTEFTEVHYE